MTKPKIGPQDLRRGHRWYLAKPERWIVDVAQHFGLGGERAWRDGWRVLGLERKRPGGTLSTRYLTPREERAIARRIIEGGERVGCAIMATILAVDTVLRHRGAVLAFCVGVPLGWWLP